MEVKRRAKKVLKSTLILAMVLVLSVTTLTQAYATYASIKIEHAWVDNAPGSGATPEEMMSEAEGIEHKLTSEWLFENSRGHSFSDYTPTPQDHNIRTDTFESVWDEAAIDQYAQQACEKMGQDAAVGLLDQADALKQLYGAIPEKPEPAAEPGTQPEEGQYGTEEEYTAALAEWEARNAAYNEYQELDRQYQELSQDYQDLCRTLVRETYEAWSAEHGDNIFSGDAFSTNGILPEDAANRQLQSDIVFHALATETAGSFWTSFLHVLQNPGEYVSLPDEKSDADYGSLKDSFVEGELAEQFFPEGTGIPL